VIHESVTRLASSISSSDTSENPRTVPSTPGSPTIRDPFANFNDNSLYPSPRTGNPAFSIKADALYKNSPLCLAEGEATKTRLPALEYAR
jgi:hypothetical protein